MTRERIEPACEVTDLLHAERKRQIWQVPLSGSPSLVGYGLAAASSGEDAPESRPRARVA
ncbi:hypothetical protein LNKW23_26200 [Paralimibaculum aggregatum]|uniref:Uncharacterized protein n=1 Tax=Paralimibaculum aggregatum TaxID=3036245 RepID=A0ABQ6LNX7_9RHOB|nr:hypothetical protein LNKW23_26200 [Limibaculum sp. NKW23]